MSVMKRLVSLFLLCSALFLFVVAHGAVTYAEEGISEGDLCKRQLLSFLQSDAILDLGLYSSPEIGVAALRCKYPEFNELCLENGLKSTLMKTALSYPDKLKASLLVAWYSGR